MKVTLFGHEYEVIFNMAVQIEFEEMSGQQFDLGGENRPGTLGTQKATMQLCYASLKVANNKLPFSFDQLIGKEPFDLELGLSVGETADLKNAVIDEMFEWFAIPKVMLEEEKPQADDEPKNA
jgi:hypothetical protein